MITFHGRITVDCDGTIRFYGGKLKSEATGILSIGQGEKVEPGSGGEMVQRDGKDDLIRIFFHDVRSVDALIQTAEYIKARMLAHTPENPKTEPNQHENHAQRPI